MKVRKALPWLVGFLVVVVAVRDLGAPDVVHVNLPASAQFRTRSAPPTRLVVHTTGRGLTRAALKANPTTAREFDEAAVQWYRDSGTDVFPQWLVGQSGTIFKLAPLEKIARHTGGTSRGDQYAWWRARWPGASSGADLIDGPYVNNTTESVDLIPDENIGYTEAQIAALKWLLRKRSSELGLPFRRQYILGHSDIDPQSRGGNNPWDPGPAVWARLSIA